MLLHFGGEGVAPFYSHAGTLFEDRRTLYPASQISRRMEFHEHVPKGTDAVSPKLCYC